MLISKEVEVKWNSKTQKHYLDKGYEFTKMKDSFMVKTEDLTHGSKARVDVCCDNPNCTKGTWSVFWGDYLRCLRNETEYYCQKCGTSMFGGEQLRLNLLKNGKSFEVWCKEHNRNDILDRWDYDLNKYKPNDIAFGSKASKFYFKCPRGLHDSEAKSIRDFTSKQTEGIIRCSKCHSFAQYLIDLYGDNALDLYWDYDKNIINPWDITQCCATKVWIKCQKKLYHGSTEIQVSAFNSMGVRCSYCGNVHTHILDSVGTTNPNIHNVWSDNNDKTPYEYMPSSDVTVWFKCENGEHEDYERNLGNSTRLEYRCPSCVQERIESFAQESTRLYLNKLGYKVLHEGQCTLKLKNKIKHNYTKRLGSLKYDNEIILNNKHLIIEVHGLQHYEMTTWNKRTAEIHGSTAEYEFQYTKEKDIYKKEYAISKGYGYLELPYWVFDKNNTYKTMINAAISNL